MRWIPLASSWPATLNSEIDATRLTDGQTPEAWGMDIDHPGYLAVGAAPTGTDRIAKTYTVSATVYNWYYTRLWKATTTTLEYGYPEYTASFIPHDIPLAFTEDANNLITFFPFLGNAMFVAKSTGAYSIPNAASPGGGFKHSDINPALGIATAAQATELDGIAYISTANGFFAWDSQGVAELSAAFRTQHGRFAAATLKRDETKRRIIGSLSGSTVFVYDVPSKKFFDYSQSGFRFTSRKLVSRTAQRPAEKPFSVAKVGFYYDNTTQGDHTIQFQVRRDEDWEDPVDVNIAWGDNTRSWIEHALPTNYAARSFQLRITSLTPSLQIKSIGVNTDIPSQTEQSWSQ